MTKPLPPAGRYAPSPTGDLHVGNLRTALIAWCAARSTGRKFYLRCEDIDTQRSRPAYAERQREDLLAIGLDFDGEETFQHDNYPRYEEALAQLPVYECYCTRADLQQAASAPHGIPGQYPGTCRDLTASERQRRREQCLAAGRTPALRLYTETNTYSFADYFLGEVTGEVDDFIVSRGGRLEGAAPDWAYNFAVVIDDGAAGIDQIVRGNDLVPATARQAYLASLLGLPPAQYVHVPLVVNSKGVRLAKRDGAITLRQLQAQAVSPANVFEKLAASMGFFARTPAELLAKFRLDQLQQTPSVWHV